MSFKVFARARPISTAFLLNETAAFDAVCDGLVTWTMEAWGGRASPLALIEQDGTLSEDAWQELVHFDPDQIWSLAPVSGELLGKLDVEFAPWLVTAPKQNQAGSKADDEPIGDSTPNPATWQEERIQAAGIPVPPTKRNLGALQGRPLLLFNFGNDCPALLRRFVHRNFGTYHQWTDPRSGEREDRLPSTPVVQLQVNCVPSLCDAMERIAGRRGGPDWKLPIACTAPCELSSVHLPRPFPRGAFEHAYHVVVGSGIRDFLLYWRTCLNEGRGVWDAPFRHCLWVPKELIGEESFVAALRNWLYCFTGQGNSDSRDVEVTSASLSTESLAPLASALQKGTFHLRMRSVSAGDLEASWRKERASRDEPPCFISLLNRDNAQQLDSAERTRAWELRPPDVIHSEVPSGVWAVDVQIERESREGGLLGQDWWVLPRRSGRVLVTSMFGTRARISRLGLFAVQVERAFKWPDTLTTPHLEMHLPSDDQVVTALLLNSRTPWFDYTDARRDRLQFKPAVAGMAISDAGRKMRALIEIFGGFRRARHYWERAFWRDIFYQMAGRYAKYDKRFRADTEQVVEKELKNLTALAGERKEVARRISGRVLGLVHERLIGTPMTFAEIGSARLEHEKFQGGEQPGASGKEIRHLAGDTIVHRMNVSPVTSEEMNEGLKELTELAVLRMGMATKCPRCRWEDWHDADKLRQTGACRGCGSPVPLVPQTQWSYRLNPLVQHCVRHRHLAEWQAVAGLADGLGSFFFTPSSELFFANSIDGKPKRELDVLCVSEGKLLLGQVKDCELKREDFQDFVEIVEVLRPNRAAIFVSEEYYTPNKDKVDRWRDEFRQQLEPFGVRGELHCLPSY